MTRDDRFSLKDDPEIQQAKRVQVDAGLAPLWLGPALTLALGLGNASLLLTAQHWPGWLGGLLGIVAALLGFVAWRKNIEGVSGPPLLLGYSYGTWLLLSFITFTQGRDLDLRLTAGVLRAVDLILPALYIVVIGVFVWKTIQRNRRA